MEVHDDWVNVAPPDTLGSGFRSSSRSLPEAVPSFLTAPGFSPKRKPSRLA